MYGPQGLSRFLRRDEKTHTTIVLETMPPAGLQPPSGDVVDASAAAIMLNLAAIGVRTSTIASVCATSESSVKRVQRHAAQHSGVARVPCKGKGKRHDPRWHFGGALGQSNLARLDRLMASMDASSTLEMIGTRARAPPHRTARLVHPTPRLAPHSVPAHCIPYRHSAGAEVQPGRPHAGAGASQRQVVRCLDR